MLEMKPAVRKWIYAIIAATVPLLISLGSLTGEMGEQILNVAAAVLAIGGSALAISNVPNQPK
jgi:elongation factor P hydroxylase